MKKSLHLLFATMILGAVVTAANIPQNPPNSAGGDPVPICPPGGCAIN